ncbi:S9 family peptidase [Undibacterium sp. Ji83W]|uniref:S9 family peptidase n=1 Tax=Undibacterium sp. Ji83W TaxID=3413043 RepID=UPI003BEF6315
MLRALFIVFTMSVSLYANAASSNADVAPIAPRLASKKTYHGQTYVDHYHWLSNKQDPRVMAYLQQENAYTEKQMAALQPLAARLFETTKARVKEVDMNLPQRHGQFYYYTRIEAGQQHALICRRAAKIVERVTNRDNKWENKWDDSAAEEILLDLNQLARQHRYVALGEFHVSPDGSKLAYALDFSGDLKFELFIKDLKTGRLLPDRAQRVSSMAWAADNQTLFYVQDDAVTLRSERLYRQRLGGKPVLQYRETAQEFGLYVSSSLDEKLILLDSSSYDSNEARILPSAQPEAPWQLVQARQKDQRYSVDHREGILYITTNRDALNFRIVTTSIDQPSAAYWKNFSDYDPEVLTEKLEVYRDFMAVTEKKQAVTRMRFYHFTQQRWQALDFDETAYFINGMGGDGYESPTYRVFFQSPLTPRVALEVDVLTGQRKVLKRYEVQGNYDPNQYETRRLWASAKDGAQIPLWAVYKKGVALDGSAPLLLYGYGAYGEPSEAHFDVSRINLLERGVIYVEAGIRGGNDLGEQWRADGMLMKKKNSFNDFIAASEYLIAQGWTRPDKLIIHGASAGGLLMGAVLNERPDLFHAAVLEVPFVDSLNTMMNPKLPLTTGEYLEWGNPKNKTVYDYLRSYAPYDNIQQQAYPAMLVLAGLNDSQVHYWEPAKYVAKLRVNKTDQHQLLLKTNLHAGHSGASGRYGKMQEAAFQHAWMLGQWGMAD